MANNDPAWLIEIRDRANSAGLEIESRETIYQDGTRTTYYLLIPSENDFRKVFFSNEERAKEILDTDFEHITFLADYEAIANSATKSIEALLTSHELPSPASMFDRLLGQKNRPDLDDDGTENGESPGEISCESDEGFHLKISPSTQELINLSSRRPSPIRSRYGSLSISIDGVEFDSAQKALRILETVSDALFFQIEIDQGLAFSLRKTFPRRGRSLSARRRTSDRSAGYSINYPSFEYDKAPLSLYWYARSARGMPLLQYLAFYQVVEYYFPTFSALESVRRARKILKNPTFRAERESDLTKLVSSIVSTGRVGGSERDQFKATILEVLSIEEVDEFFACNEDIGEVLSKKQKGITERTINIGRKSHDHRHDIAELLYDIRCRIVHTKNDNSDSKKGMLLPFSTEEEDLWANIKLMQFVAQHTLIRSSTTMTKF